MKKLQKAALQLRRRLDRRGETITETLVALAISALAMAALATLIVTSTRLTAQSREQIAAYYEENNRLAGLTPEDADGEGVLILSEEDGSRLRFTEDEPDDGIEISYYINDTGNTAVISYQQKQ